MRIPKRWFIATLLFAAGLLNYLDRSALSIAAPLLKHELHLQDIQLGMIYSSFFFGYAVFCFIGGWCADRFGVRMTFMVSAGVWSIFCGLSSLASGFLGLLIIRVFFGMAEGPMASTANKGIADWFPRRENGRAVGFISAGQPLGAAIAAPIVGLVSLQFGWRVAFVIVALLGVIWMAVWWRFYRDEPDEKPVEDGCDSAAHNVSASGSNGRGIDLAAARNSVLPLGKYLLSPPVLGVAVAFFSFNYVLYLFLSWLPSYFVDYRHLDIHSMSIVAMLPWLAAMSGHIGGGAVSDAIFKRTGNALFARKTTIVFGLSVAAIAVVFVARAETLFGAVSALGVASFSVFMAPQACWSILREIVPQSRIGAVGGFVHMLSNIAGILAPSITGYLVQYGGGYSAAFIFTAVLSAGSVVVVLAIVRGPVIQKMLLKFS